MPFPCHFSGKLFQSLELQSSYSTPFRLAFIKYWLSWLCPWYLPSPESGEIWLVYKSFLDHKSIFSLIFPIPFKANFFFKEIVFTPSPLIYLTFYSCHPIVIWLLSPPLAGYFLTTSFLVILLFSSYSASVGFDPVGLFLFVGFCSTTLLFFVSITDLSSCCYFLNTAVPQGSFFSVLIFSYSLSFPQVISTNTLVLTTFPNLCLQLRLMWASLVGQMVKNLPSIHETRVQSLSQEDPLEKGMATHSSILACRIPWCATIHGVTESDTTEWLTFSNVRTEYSS